MRKKKCSLRNEKLRENRASETEEQRKERLRIEDKIRKWENRKPRETAPVHSQKIEARWSWRETVNLTYETYRQYIYISREISIEHPSVKLASLAQIVDITPTLARRKQPSLSQSLLWLVTRKLRMWSVPALELEFHIIPKICSYYCILFW